MNDSVRDICINITRRCNLRCPECYVSDLIHQTNTVGEVDLSLDTIQEILDMSAIDSVYLTGGEPFCHPKIKEIISFFFTNGKNVRVATNALLLNEEMMQFLEENSVQLLVSLRDNFKETYDIVNMLGRHNVQVVCYHLPDEGSPDLLSDFIQKCPSVKNIKLLYNSKNSPTVKEWFSLLNKIYNRIKCDIQDVSVTVEVGFLPKQNKIAMSPKRGAFDRIHISTEGLFYSCPLLVLEGNGKKELPPEKCIPEKCPIFARKLDDDRFASVCCFQVTSIENAVLLAKWGGIE